MINTLLHNRALIRLSPGGSDEDVREFLQGLVTQDLTLVQPGAPQWSALLTAQGKVLFDFFLWADAGQDGDILLDCESDHAAALSKRLALYRLRRKITITPEPDLSVHWCKPQDPSSANKPADPRLAELGHRWLEPAASNDDIGDGAEPADAAYHAHRLSLGVMEGQMELGSDKILWLECNAAELNGVSFTAGCYVGQENTARMNYRNKVNRRLVAVPMEQADEDRQRATYPDLNLSIEHRRIEDLQGLSLPLWLQEAIDAP